MLRQLSDYNSLTNVWCDEILLLLAFLQLLLQLSKLNADHVQVALVIRLQLVHNGCHVADLGLNTYI